MVGTASEVGEEHDLPFEAPAFETEVRVRHGVETDALGDTRFDLTTCEHAEQRGEVGDEPFGVLVAQERR